MSRSRSYVFLVFAISSWGCGSTSNVPGPSASEPVVELAIRRVHDGQDVAGFEAARDAFVARLRDQEGVGVDRELRAFFDFGTGGDPEAPVFVGMTRYESAGAFEAAGDALGSSPEAAAFFATFTPRAFTALRPLREGTSVDLASIADQPGQVLEIAVRDLSTYDGFRPEVYEAARDRFLELLREQPGFVAEYQWVSTLDPDLVVGMTVYESREAFFGVLGNEAFATSPATTEFLTGFPPTTAYVSAVLR